MSLSTRREEPPFPNAKTRRKCLNAFFLWSTSPWKVQDQLTDCEKPALGLFVVWLWTFFSLRETCKGAGSGREKWMKRMNFLVPFRQVLLLWPFAWPLHLYSPFTRALIYQQFTSDLSLANRHRLANKHTNFPKIITALTLPSDGPWAFPALRQFLRQAELRSQLPLTGPSWKHHKD